MLGRTKEGKFTTMSPRAMRYVEDIKAENERESALLDQDEAKVRERRARLIERERGVERDAIARAEADDAHDQHLVNVKLATRVQQAMVKVQNWDSAPDPDAVASALEAFGATPDLFLHTRACGDDDHAGHALIYLHRGMTNQLAKSEAKRADVERQARLDAMADEFAAMQATAQKLEMNRPGFCRGSFS